MAIEIKGKGLEQLPVAALQNTTKMLVENERSERTTLQELKEFIAPQCTAEQGNLILEWNTDQKTTRLGVPSSRRKSGVQISYNSPTEGWQNEQYVGLSTADEDWGNSANWSTSVMEKLYEERSGSGGGGGGKQSTSSFCGYNFEELTFDFQNTRKVGYNYPQLFNKTIVGLHIKSNKPNKIKYGKADISGTNVSNPVEVGSIQLEAKTENDYPINLKLGDNQVFWLQQEGGNSFYYSNRVSKAADSFVYDDSNSSAVVNSKNAYSFYILYQDGNGGEVEIVRKKSLSVRVEELEKKAGVGDIVDTDVIAQYDALGDSVTYGTGSNDDVSPIKSYAVYLSEYLSAQKFVNHGQGGHTITNDMVQQIMAIKNTPSLVTLCFGINDAIQNGIHASDFEIKPALDILKMSNDNADDYTLSTLYQNGGVLGRFRWCLEYLQKKYPKCRIICILPTELAASQSEKTRTTLEQIRISESAICSFLNIQCVDLRKVSDAFSSPNWDAFLKDGVHPLKYGYQMMAGAIYHVII